ncbi:MAG: MBOAT family protein [Clostridia bacterium]|nr:MBOAT family protein [Clostridia bacterium]
MQSSSFLLAGAVSKLSSFFSVSYLFMFLPVSILLYFIAPKKLKKYVLLTESMLFFWLISGKLIVYLLFAVLIMHYCGIWLNSLQDEQRRALSDLPREERKPRKKRFERKQNAVVSFSVILLIGTLLVLKYSSFFSTNINTLFDALKLDLRIPVPSYIMPVGISFFSLQALSYIIDVRRGVVKADRNPVRLALFLSFFPQIVEGPIIRYSQTAMQLWNADRLSLRNLKLGMQRIMFGMIKKMIIADRLNPFVTNIFDNYTKFEGGMVAIGAIAYTIQLYMDFSGSMDVVIGTAQIFGISLPENFRQPFFSKSISEFWTRWHITLGTWFKDYIFLSITGSAKMKKLTSSARKKIGNHYGPLLAGSAALFCVWLANGLWHGAAWNYIFFGLYHFALILSGSLIKPLSRKFFQAIKIDPKHTAYQIFQMLRTGLLVVIGELFFRANGFRNGWRMFCRMISDFHFGAVDGTLIRKLGLDMYDCIIIAVTLLIVFAVSILHERGISVRATVEKKNVAVRWGFCYAMMAYIIMFGAYGIGYAAVDPLYAQF